jgi:lipopolysaccharide export system protein LptA
VRISSFNRLPWTGRLLFFFLLLMCWPSFRLVADTDSPNPPADAIEGKRIDITAQRLISDSANNNAEFVGDVRLRQGDTVITADSLKLFFGSESKTENASPAQSLEKLVATGNVEIKFDNRLAVAQQAVYITAQRVLTLTGPEATITSGDNTISGDTITFYRDSGRFTVEGGPNKGRVKAIILNPEDSGLE